MTDRLRSLADSLKAGGQMGKKRGAKKRAVSSAVEIALIEETLLQLLNASESDSVRIAAAKVLLERKGALKKDEHDAQMREAAEREIEDREAAIAEAQALLAEFALAKSAGVCESGALDQNGAAAAVDAAKPGIEADEGMAHLAGDGGTRLGQDQSGG